MILKAYSIRDGKAEAFNPPFFMASKGLAMRGFMDLVNDPNTTIAKYPGDFSLYEIGEFDDSNGRYQQYDTFVLLAIANELIVKKPSVVVPAVNGTEPHLMVGIDEKKEFGGK